MPARNPIPVGTRFARLVTTGPGEQRRWPAGSLYYAYPCKCNCGNSVAVQGASLKNGNTQSCGCLQKEAAAALKLDHGLWDLSSRTYRIWLRMRARCYSRNNTAWKYYGGKGVKICERWQDYPAFLADKGECPPGMEIDRWPDKAGDYTPENTRWATRKQQCRNTSSNRVLTVLGVTGCVAELSEHFNIKSSVVSARLNRYGWTPEKAFMTPAQKRSARRPKVNDSGPNRVTGVANVE